MSARVRVGLSQLCALLLAWPAASARGQVTADSGVVTSAWSSADGSVGPTLRAASVGARQPSVAEDTRALLQQRRNAGLGQSQALMIVGGGAILLGALIGDDAGKVIMVGGVVILLYGAYKYLQ